MKNKGDKTMDTLKGGFRFESDVIDQEIPNGIIGNYLLSEGLRSRENRLIVTYVGRSVDLNRRLKEHLSDKERYIWFWYRNADTEHEAYLQECRDFHTYQAVHKLNNVVHPSKVQERDLCPICGQ